MRFLTLVSMTVSCAAFVGSLAFADSPSEPPLFFSNLGSKGSAQAQTQAASVPPRERPAGRTTTRCRPAGWSIRATSQPRFSRRGARPPLPWPWRLPNVCSALTFGRRTAAPCGRRWPIHPTMDLCITERTSSRHRRSSFRTARCSSAATAARRYGSPMTVGGPGTARIPPIAGRVVDIEVSPAFAVDGQCSPSPLGQSSDPRIAASLGRSRPAVERLANAEMVLSSHYAVDNTVVIRLSDSTLWRTSDAGATWTRVDEGLGTTIGNTVTDLDVAAVGSNSVALLAATAANLSLSYDFGTTWLTLSPNTFSVIEAPDQPGPALLAFALTGSQAMVTYDTGQTWTPISTEWNLRDLALSPSFAHDQTVYICGDYRMWMTHNAGRTWIREVGCDWPIRRGNQIGIGPLPTIRRRRGDICCARRARLAAAINRRRPRLDSADAAWTRCETTHGSLARVRHRSHCFSGTRPSRSSDLATVAVAGRRREILCRAVERAEPFTRLSQRQPGVCGCVLRRARAIPLRQQRRHLDPHLRRTIGRSLHHRSRHLAGLPR